MEQIGKDYRLKVFNKSFGTAKNVRLEMLAGADVVLESDLLHKFPIPLLERHQVTELLLPVHMGSSSRVNMKLTWDDETGENRSKELWVDIF